MSGERAPASSLQALHPSHSHPYAIHIYLQQVRLVLRPHRKTPGQRLPSITFSLWQYNDPAEREMPAGMRPMGSASNQHSRPPNYQFPCPHWILCAANEDCFDELVRQRAIHLHSIYHLERSNYGGTLLLLHSARAPAPWPSPVHFLTTDSSTAELHEADPEGADEVRTLSAKPRALKLGPGRRTSKRRSQRTEG
jgi:hypothetical protein